jgi:hypothetical protein
VLASSGAEPDRELESKKSQTRKHTLEQQMIDQAHEFVSFCSRSADLCCFSLTDQNRRRRSKLG